MTLAEIAALNPTFDPPALAEELALVQDACGEFDLACLPAKAI